MHNLQVQNFLGIKDAEIDLDGMTVIIGAQASGKSVIARLIYFFNDYFSDFDTTAISSNEHKKTFDSRKRREFYQIFPPYSWEKDEFSIRYSNGEHEVSIGSAANSSGISISTSEGVATYFRNLKNTYRAFTKGTPQDAMTNLSRTRLRFEFREYLNETGELPYEAALFVPAARSFYATIRDEIFSILALDEKIDKIILQFGEFYESQKTHFSRRANREEAHFFEKIVKGKYIRRDGRDWVEMERGAIELNKASSGQQEAAPLLFAIARYPGPNRTLIIEEPEAHLFPSAQTDILEFMVRQCTRHESDFLFTTHSPYMLSSLNNFILAGSQGLEWGIDPDWISAYSLEDGKSYQLVDEETGLISADYIDSVSDEINEKFLELVEDET